MNDLDTPTGEDEDIDTVADTGIQPQPVNPESTKLTASQQKRMDAIEGAVELLHAGEVSFMLIASPDVPTSKMRFVRSSRLGYGRRLAGIAAQTQQCRSQMLSIALEHLSVGLNGLLFIATEDGTPLYWFQDGKMHSADERPTPEVVV